MVLIQLKVTFSQDLCQFLVPNNVLWNLPHFKETVLSYLKILYQVSFFLLISFTFYTFSQESCFYN